MREDVLILDNSLREGEQVPGLAFAMDERFRLLEALDEVGVDMIDLGIPAISGEDAAFCREARRRLRHGRGGVSIRARLDELALAAELEIPEIYVMFPFSEIHMERKFRLGRAELEERMDRLLEEAARRELTVNLVAEDASRGSMELVGRLALRAAQGGARCLLLCDTVGTALPTAFADRVRQLRALLPSACELGVHCHDDFGMATANTVAALEAGARIASVTVNGLGERAGNAPLHEVVLAVTQLLKRPCSVETTGLPALSRLVEELSAIALSPLAAGVGRNAFLHESGIHVDGLLKDPSIYEGLRPEVLGRRRAHALGSSTGSAFLKRILEEQGIEATAEGVEAFRMAIRKEKRKQSRDACRRSLAAYHRSFEEAFTFPEERVVPLATASAVEGDEEP